MMASSVPAGGAIIFHDATVTGTRTADLLPAASRIIHLGKSHRDIASHASRAAAHDEVVLKGSVNSRRGSMSLPE
jgi:hypothetical protein